MQKTSRLATRTPFYYGWVVAAAVGISMLASSSMAAPVFSVFIEPWTEEFGWSRTAISGVFSVASLMAAFAGPLFGRAVDRYGGRLILGGGLLVLAGSLIAMGFVASLIAFYVVFPIGRIIMMNIQNLVSHTVVANWFVRRRALATAVVLNGNRFGLGMWPWLASAIMIAFDWRMAFWVMGSIVVLLAFVPLMLVVARRPEQIGLQVDGRDAIDTMASGRPGRVEHQWTIHDAVRTRAFWLLMAAHTALMVSGAGMGVHRVAFFVGGGLSDGWIGPLLVFNAVGMSTGGFTGAFLMRYVATRKVIDGYMFGVAIAMLVVMQVPANGIALPYAFIEGMMSGGAFAMMPVIYADYYGRRSIGTIRGLTHPVVMSANAVGPMIAVVVFDWRGDYSWAFVSFSAVEFAGAIAAWLARPPVASPVTSVDSVEPPTETGPDVDPV